MAGSAQDLILDYYLLMAKLAKALSLASATLYELIDCKESQQSVDHNSMARDVLTTMKIVPDVFRTLTNFTIVEFEELCTIVCPVIAMHARSTGDVIIQGRGRPPKSAVQEEGSFKGDDEDDKTFDENAKE